MTRRTDDGGAVVLPAYVEKIIAAYAGGTVVPGTVGMVEVRHDDSCAIWKGDSCDCEPDIELVYPEVKS